MASTSKRRCCKFYFLSTLLMLWIGFGLWSTTSTPTPDGGSIDTATTTKTILIWNGRTRFELDVFGEGRAPFRTAGCAVDDCLLTRNKSLVASLHQFDAVIVNTPTFARLNFPADAPRRPEQRYIFFSQEAPPYMSEDVSHYDGFFNWTMDYQSDSDVPYTYGRVVALASAPPDPTEASRRIAQHRWQTDGLNYAENKTKLVAWFASHCYTQSRREKYVALLRKHIDVDVYGGCHMRRCEQNTTSYLSSDGCYDMVERHYKFYLSFENALCHDYVTEKFFDLLERRVVPVVLGGADYAALAPPHSFIDASQYSPRQLADYLRRLDADDRLYNEFFWWKPHYRVEGRYPFMAQRALCQLCRKLHTDGDVSVYHNISDYFGRSKRCHQPQFKGVHMLWGFI